MTGARVPYSTAVVTGASRGLGLAIARALSERGLNVVGASRSRPPTDAGFTWIRANLSEQRDIQRVFARARELHGTVDVLVNNAAGGWVGQFERDDPDAVRRLVDVNLTGAILCTREAIPDMLAAGSGLVVNVASDWGRRYAPGAAVYAATKFGIVGFSGSLLREVKDRGVKVVCVMPGAIATGWGGIAQERSPEARDVMPPADLARIVVGLLDMPEDMLVHELMVHAVGQPEI